MRVCVVGSGGREHAIAHVLSRTATVVSAPGNPGAAACGSVTGSPPEEVDADLFVIGPEAPLVGGLADRLRASGRLVVGPGADGARLEGSKAWMKELLAAAGVPTAPHEVFAELEPARRWLSGRPGPYVVKTDGLASGKGVLVTDSLKEALADVEAKLSGRAFGSAGRRVVLEEPLFGLELSVMALCDGRRAVPLAPARDHKRLRDGDEGPNTGGMGACSPVLDAPAGVVSEVMDSSVEPLLAELLRRGVEYRGVLYAGLMLTETGPKVLEFNVRFGDPEAQVVLPRFSGDLSDLLMQAAEGRIRAEPDFAGEACATVVMAAAGYPWSPRSGDIITGVEEADSEEGVVVFHAGTSRDEAGRLVTAGGRVLDVTGMGPTVEEACGRAYAAVEAIGFDGAQYRRDIGTAGGRHTARGGSGGSSPVIAGEARRGHEVVR
jgi:phosphoribosylamine--glycine ligase